MTGFKHKERHDNLSTYLYNVLNYTRERKDGSEVYVGEGKMEEKRRNQVIKYNTTVKLFVY